MLILHLYASALPVETLYLVGFILILLLLCVHMCVVHAHVCVYSRVYV